MPHRNELNHHIDYMVGEQIYRHFLILWQRIKIFDNNERTNSFKYNLNKKTRITNLIPENLT